MSTAARGTETEGTRPFYGWVVVLGVFVLLFIGFGTAYSFAAFFTPLEEQFHAPRGEIALVFSITGFLYFGLGAVSGPIADRTGPRRVVLVGILLTGLGLLLASRARTLWQVYLTYSLGVGVGVGFVYVPAIGCVQRWFVRRRGFASGIAVAGIGVGNLVMPLLAARMISATDWRTAYLALGLLALLAGAAATLLIDHSPERRGLLPDGDAAAPGVRPASGRRALAPGMAVRTALRSRPFALLYIACVATSVGLFIPFAHLARYARDHGLSEVAAAGMVSLIGVGSAAGRLALGNVADRLGRRQSVAAMFAGMGLMLLWWLAARDVWSLALFAVLFGVCYGGFVALIPALTTDYFGGRNAGTIIGVLYTSVSLGTLVGPPLAGRFYDLRESYAIPIIFGAAANLIAVGCMLLIADPARWRSEHAT